MAGGRSVFYINLLNVNLTVSVEKKLVLFSILSIRNPISSRIFRVFNLILCMQQSDFIEI